MFEVIKRGRKWFVVLNGRDLAAYKKQEDAQAAVDSGYFNCLIGV